MKKPNGWTSIITLLCICGLIALTAGCKDLNDNPPPEREPTARINVADLQSQLSAGAGLHETDATEFGDRSVTSSDSDVSSEAKTILVGAIVVTKRGTPYPDDVTPTGSIPKFFGNDLYDSGEYLQLIDLPVTETYIEFKVPPPSAGNWQVIAVAFSTQPELVSDLTETEHKNSAIYFGVNENFFTADDIGTTPVPIKMRRVCLSGNAPKGCASFGASLTADPVVTASVEIVGIKLNGDDYTPATIDFPIFVRTAADVTSAITSLKTIRDEISDSQTPSSLTVRATHAENTTESTECQALADVTNENEFTNTRLRTHCEVSEYRVIY